MSYLFEQQPRESAKAFAAFSLYLSQGAERSIEECARKFLKSSRLLRRWAQKFDWSGRVAAHATHLAVVEREAVIRAPGAARGAPMYFVRQSRRELRMTFTNFSLVPPSVSVLAFLGTGALTAALLAAAAIAAVNMAFCVSPS